MNNLKYLFLLSLICYVYEFEALSNHPMIISNHAKNRKNKSGDNGIMKATSDQYQDPQLNHYNMSRHEDEQQVVEAKIKINEDVKRMLEQKKKKGILIYEVEMKRARSLPTGETLRVSFRNNQRGNNGNQMKPIERSSGSKVDERRLSKRRYYIIISSKKMRSNDHEDELQQMFKSHHLIVKREALKEMKEIKTKTIPKAITLTKVNNKQTKTKVENNEEKVESNEDVKVNGNESDDQSINNGEGFGSAIIVLASSESESEAQPDIEDAHVIRDVAK
jgi:hypothetical protein